MLDRTWLSKRLEGFPQRTIPRETLRPAAVLLPLLIRDGEECVLFTRRTEHLPHHAGEISFPGGAAHPDDPDLAATALRETEEELGIPADRVALHGRLDDFWSIHGYHVVPFVGTIPHPFPYRIAGHEIAELIEAPLDHFRTPGVHHVEDWSHRGRVHPVDFYRYGSHVIWGLTAAILRQFLAVTDPAAGETGP
ncbi:MAG: CoA pyrophosphatase [Deltaproteobacteria bacterium]|nr:MAG: CoA pyrophosphatase [Deltaproteobacteria bacterium]